MCNSRTTIWQTPVFNRPPWKTHDWLMGGAEPHFQTDRYVQHPILPTRRERNVECLLSAWPLQQVSYWWRQCSRAWELWAEEREKFQVQSATTAYVAQSEDLLGSRIIVTGPRREPLQSRFRISTKICLRWLRYIINSLSLSCLHDFVQSPLISFVFRPNIHTRNLSIFQGYRRILTPVKEALFLRSQLSICPPSINWCKWKSWERLRS